MCFFIIIITPKTLVKKVLVKKVSPSNGAENASAEFVDFKKVRVPWRAKSLISTNCYM